MMCDNSCKKFIRLENIKILDITLRCDHIKFNGAEPEAYKYNEYGEALFILCAGCGCDTKVWCKYNNKLKGSVFMGKCL